MTMQCELLLFKTPDLKLKFTFEIKEKQNSTKLWWVHIYCIPENIRLRLMFAPPPRRLWGDLRLGEFFCLLH